MRYHSAVREDKQEIGSLTDSKIKSDFINSRNNSLTWKHKQSHIETWFCWKHVLLWAFFFSKLFVSCGACLLHFKQSLQSTNYTQEIALTCLKPTINAATNHSVKCRALHRDTKFNPNCEIFYQDANHARVEWMYT